MLSGAADGLSYIVRHVLSGDGDDTDDTLY